jgi:hypothetical protein
MFDKIKGAFNRRVEVARDMRAHPGPADLAALPPGCAAIGGLGAVPVEAVGAYVGIEVRTVRQLDALGPESSGLIGDAIRTRMRDAGVADPNLAPGELVAGQNEARLARMRAEGMSEDQIAMIQAKIAEVTNAHAKSGWTVEFTNGNRASVELFELDSPDGEFGRLKAKFDFQHTKAGAEAEMRNPTEFAVTVIESDPYEAYYLPGKLSARGRAHEADAVSSHLGTLALDETLAALAILALHSLDG